MVDMVCFIAAFVVWTARITFGPFTEHPPLVDRRTGRVFVLFLPHEKRPMIGMYIHAGN